MRCACGAGPWAQSQSLVIAWLGLPKPAAVITEVELAAVDVGVNLAGSWLKLRQQRGDQPNGEP